MEPQDAQTFFFDKIRWATEKRNELRTEKCLKYIQANAIGTFDMVDGFKMSVDFPEKMLIYYVEEGEFFPFYRCFACTREILPNFLKRIEPRVLPEVMYILDQKTPLAPKLGKISRANADLSTFSYDTAKKQLRPFDLSIVHPYALCHYMSQDGSPENIIGLFAYSRREWPAQKLELFICQTGKAHEWMFSVYDINKTTQWQRIIRNAFAKFKGKENQCVYAWAVPA